MAARLISLTGVIALAVPAWHRTCVTPCDSPQGARSGTEQGSRAMTNEFTVVGEHRDDELELLVLGADGSYYGYRPAQEAIRPVQLDDETWIISRDADLEDVDGPPSAEQLRTVR